jgi:RNA polymerase sigma-70 factor (ECF subfamily)
MGEGIADSELVKRAQEKDREAYRILVERYQSRAYSLAFSILKNKQDAEDVVQESFVKVYLSIGKFKGESSFYTWLYRIVRNMSIDVKRKLNREKTHQPESDNISIADQAAANAVQSNQTYSPDYELLRKEKARRIAEVLNDISEEHRTVIILREVDGMDYKQISQVTGVSKGTIMSRLHYARKKLQQGLADLVNKKDENPGFVLNKTKLNGV